MKPRIAVFGRSLLLLLPVLLTVFVLLLGSMALASPAAPGEGASKAPVAGGQSPRIQGGKTKRPAFAPDELLVKFREGVPAEKKERLHARHGAKKLREYKPLRLHRIKLKEGETVENAVAKYRLDPDVEYAEPNFIVSNSRIPSPNYDQYFGSLWGISKINAEGAWDFTTGSQNVVVAILDTGVDVTHPDLAGNIWGNTAEIAGNGIDDDENGFVDDVNGINAINFSGNPIDDNGHGTHVAGTIGAIGNNGIGVVGVNWSVKIIACKFLDSSGSGFISGAVECLLYVKALKDRGVNIVASNNSWGGGGYSQALYDAIKAQPDILFIAAAGNDSSDNDLAPYYPAGYGLPNVISVAATDSSDSLASFSNYGKYSVAVGAPGKDILSTLPAQNFWNISGGYGTLSGTSMATPHVTGLAALLKAQDPARDGAKIKNLIMSSGDDLPALADKSLTGKRINAFGSTSGNNRSVLSLGWLPSHVTSGNTYTLSALSIDRDSPAPVTVATGDGATIPLSDSGVSPDAVAGDGIFSGSWTAGILPVTLTFSTSTRSKTITLTDIAIENHIADVRQDAPYSQPLRASGGSLSYTWSIIGGSLPTGLTLDSGTGIISGTATVPGTYPFTAQVTDSRGASATAPLNLVVDSSGFVDEMWGRVYDSGGDEKGWGVATDAAGNSYVTGQTYNGRNLDVVLRKYDAAGNLVWSRTYDRGSDESSRSITCDRNTGNVYIAGVAGVPGDHLLLKYDSSGNLLWEKTWDRGGDDIAWGITTDSAGLVYTVGTIDTSEGTRVLLSKYDPDGNTLWTKVYQSQSDVYLTVPWDDYGYAITVDGGGNIFFGGTTVWVFNGQQSSSFLIAKYDASANLLWSKKPDTGDTSTSNVITAAAIDGAGNLYATGWSYGGPTDRNGPIYIPQLGSWGVTVKLDPAGSTLWSSGSFTGSFCDWAKAIAVSGENIYVAGDQGYMAGITIAKYDSSGNVLWTKDLDPGASGSVRGIAADSAGFTVAGFINNGIDNDIIAARYAEAPPVYDLEATAVSGTLNGNVLSYSVKVRNNGNGNPVSRVEVYFSPDAIPSNNDYDLDRAGYNLSHVFPAGEETTISGSVAVPYWVPSGTYYLTAIVDPYNRLNETTKVNNGATGDRFTLKSDLAVTSVAGTVTDGILSYAVTVKNIDKEITGASTTGLYLSRDAFASPQDYPVSFLSTPQLTAGTETVLAGTVAVPATIPPGTYQIAAIADSGDTIQDGDKSNNGAVGNYVTLPVDLTVSGLSGNLSAGTLSYTVKLKNNGRQQVAPSLALYFSPDAVASPDDHLITLLNAGNIAGGNEALLTGSVAVPATVPSGTYYLAALADPADAVSETNEANNGAVAGLFSIGTSRPSIDYALLGTGAGVVAFAPGDSCAGNCRQSYDSGSSVTLTAAPSTGSTFAGWGGACTGTGACTVTLDGDKAITATFVREPFLSYIAAGNGTGMVAFVPGTSCTGNCSQPYVAGAQVALTALPGLGSRFTGWGGACAGTGPCMVTMTGDQTVSATFDAIVPTAAAGHFHTEILTGGTVWGWGYNRYGQLGDGTSADRTSPVHRPELSAVTAIAAGHGGYGALALRADGTVWSWGYNYYGQVGDGTSTDRTSPVQVSGLSQIVAVDGGYSFNMALGGDGTVWTWGINNRGELGDGTSTPYPFLPGRTVPLPVPGLSGVVAIGAGEEHAFALKSDGTVWGWGNNGDGALGDGATSGMRTSPVQVPGLSGVVKIAGGAYHTAALKEDGTVWAWGYNSYGEAGNGTTSPMQPTPVQVSGLSGVVAIAAGSYHTLALKNDGTVWAWGNNSSGQVGNGTAGVGWHRSTPTQVSGLTGVVSIAAGSSHSVAVKGDATVWTWGDNSYGQLGDGTTVSRNTPVRVSFDITAPVTIASPSGGSYDSPQIVTLAASEPATIYYTLDGSPPTTASPVYSGPLTISATGTLRYFARDGAGNAEPVKTQLYVIAASALPNAEFTGSAVSGNAPLGIVFSDLSTGSPASWLWDFGDTTTSTSPNPVHTYVNPGSYTVSLTVTNAAGSNTKTKNSYITVTDPAQRASVDALVAGNWHSGAVVGGGVWLWGQNVYGQLGDGTTTNRTVPQHLTALADVTALGPGSDSFHSLALHGDGTVSAWGRNLGGEVGDGTTIQRNSPVTVPGLTGVVAVAGGYLFSMALKDDGTVWSWGDNAYGKLGDGTGGLRQLTPVQVAGLSGMSAIAAGSFHGIALGGDRTVRTWGYNYYGQLGDTTTMNRSTPVQLPGLSAVVAISAGYGHSVALKEDGTVWTWGGNWAGQLGDGTTGNRTTPVQVPGLSGVVAIAAGQAYTVALKGDGTVVTWGDNTSGQLGDGTTTRRLSPVPVVGLAGVVKITAGANHTVAVKGDGSLWGWGSNGFGELGDGTSIARLSPVEVVRPVIDTVAPATTVSPAGGTYNAPQTVTLTANEPATIRYTLDGSTPTMTSPLYTAPLSITSPATLKYFATDIMGNTEAVNTQAYVIAAATAPHADFTSTATTGSAPCSVAFSDASTGMPTTWLWDFGDASFSTQQNPVHVYSSPGTYTVSLTVTNVGGADARTKPSGITVANPGPAPLQPVYDSAADGNIIRLRSGSLTEQLVLNRTISVEIRGGYDFPYQQVVGVTTIHGMVEIGNGTVSLGNIIIE